MSENFDSNESEPPKLFNMSLEQGKVLVRRIENCLKENSNADLFILMDFGAAPLETIMKELRPDLDSNIEHLRLGRDYVQRLGSISVTDLQTKIDKSNIEFLRTITDGKKHIVLIDDIEYESKTLNLAETLIKFVNSECGVIKFPVIKSPQQAIPDGDAWPFALFDDAGMVNGYSMPWEVNQNKFVGRMVDGKANMRTISVDNLDPLAISLRKDLQNVSKYFKNS